ncbi:MAG: hypothetical protein AAF903_04080 [Pseudomonadota bacterium]
MSIHFDTLKLSSDLQSSGMTQELSEKLTALLQSDVLENVATKQDLRDLETSLRSDTRGLEVKIEKLETTMSTRFDALELRMNNRFEAVEQRMTTQSEALEQRMTIKLGAMMMAGVAVIVAAQKLL